MFYRERAAGMYSPLPFAIAQGNVEIPYLLFQTVICECPHCGCLVAALCGFGSAGLVAFTIASYST